MAFPFVGVEPCWSVPERQQELSFPKSVGDVIAANLVADAAYGADQRAVGTRIDLPPQVIDIHVDNVRNRIGVHPPDFFNDRCAGHRLAGVAEEIVQQRIFFRTKFDRSAGTPDLMRDSMSTRRLCLRPSGVVAFFAMPFPLATELPLRKFSGQPSDLQQVAFQRLPPLDRSAVGPSSD